MDLVHLTLLDTCQEWSRLYEELAGKHAQLKRENERLASASRAMTDPQTQRKMNELQNLVKLQNDLLAGRGEQLAELDHENKKLQDEIKTLSSAALHPIVYDGTPATLPEVNRSVLIQNWGGERAGWYLPGKTPQWGFGYGWNPRPINIGDIWAYTPSLDTSAYTAITADKTTWPDNNASVIIRDTYNGIHKGTRDGLNWRVFLGNHVVFFPIVVGHLWVPIVDTYAGVKTAATCWNCTHASRPQTDSNGMAGVECPLHPGAFLGVTHVCDSHAFSEGE